jgi:hypothetical protein
VSINPRCSSWCTAPTRRSHSAHLLSNTIIGPHREEDEKRFLAQLRAVDLSNAETLAASLELEHSLQEAYTRIAQAPDLLHPIVAKDVAAHKEGSRHQIARTVLDSFVPQLDFSFASAVYGHRFVLRERRCHRPVPERELHLSRFSEALRREEAV